MSANDRIAFFDTNILIYAEDSSNPEKRLRARQLIEDHQRAGTVAISLQVMQEYYSVVTRKLGLAPELAQRKVELLALARVVLFESKDVLHAIALHRLHQISFWDAMIVHAASICGATLLYTEDLQHGNTVAGVRIVNPFL